MIRFNELSKYQIKTIFEKGFNNEKYQEAISLIKRKQEEK